MKRTPLPPTSPTAATPAAPRDLVSGWMEEIAPYGIFTTDAKLHIRSWNQWLVAHSGLAASSVIGLPLAEVYPELETRRLLLRFQRALEGEISVLSTALHKYLLPFVVRSADGDMPYMLQTARIAPLPGPDGIDGTIAIIEDVTQREFHAATLRRQQELDRLLSAALAALLQSIDPAQDIARIFGPLMPPFGLDAYFCYLWHPANKNFRLQAASGVSPKQREGMSAMALAPEDAVNAKNIPLTAAGTIARHLRMLEGLGIRGRRCWPLAVGDHVIGFVSFGTYQQNVISAPDGSLLFRIVHFLAIAIDRAAKEREALAASRAKDDFLAALSHELRTPLNPVLLVASDSGRNEEFPEAARAAFRMIEKNAQLEARLIDDLLDLTRIEHGKTSLELQLLDPHVPVQDALANVRGDAEEKGIALHVDLAAPAVQVQADPARLQQVFWNVLKNGIKFTPARGRVWVASSLSENGKEWVLRISDTGIGMDESERERVFNAFVQGEHATKSRGHRFGGLGLGLAICKRLVEMHAGFIEAESAGRDQGSTFLIRLPLATSVETAVAPAPASAPTAPADRTRPAPVKRASRILLVEDHEPTRLPLAALLGRRGFEVVAVGTGTEALATAARVAVDLVVSDIGLPDMDGFTLMRTLHEKYALPGIALTGYGMEADIASSAAAGFVAHLTKPINASVLDRTLHSVLESHGPRA